MGTLNQDLGETKSISEERTTFRFSGVPGLTSIFLNTVNSYVIPPGLVFQIVYLSCVIHNFLVDTV